MKTGKNILICPLEWGLGHAGRMIPLAALLRDMGNRVIIGSGEEHLSFFKNELTGIFLLKFPGFRPRYSGFLPQYLIILLQLPVLIFHIIREHLRLKKIIAENDIDIVISDNRFGLWNRQVKTIYVTHMPRIPFPKVFAFLEFTGILLHRAIIKKYDFCFIPDLPGGNNISGRLSHGFKLPENVRYTGILSRFSGRAGLSGEVKDQIAIILSGPEPQRSILKNKLTGIFNDRDKNIVILGGMPGEENRSVRSGKIVYHSHLATREMKELLTESKGIISRAGYSTIMELVSLNLSALLIPTPGQTEQEYLAHHLSAKGWFSYISQKDIKPGIMVFKNSSDPPANMSEESNKLLKQAIEIILA